MSNISASVWLNHVKHKGELQVFFHSYCNCLITKYVNQTWILVNLHELCINNFFMCFETSSHKSSLKLSSVEFQKHERI